MSSVFGTPKFTTGSNYKKTEGPKTGDNFIRILPPMFSLREDGEWKKYWSTHWGFAGVGNEPGKTVMRPFRCILDKDRKTGLVRQECPACAQYEQVEAQKKEQEAQITAELKEGGATKDQIEEQVSARLQPINEWLKAHRVEGKYYVNVMFKDRSFGSYKLNHQYHMARINEIINGKRDGKVVKPGLMEAEGINPLTPDQGVWFVIGRTGTGFGTPDTTDIEYAKVEGIVNGKTKMVDEIVLAPLTDEECEKAGKECQDLTTMGGLTLSYDQIKRLVECSGDPDEIDEIMGVKQQQKAAASSTSKGAFTPPQQKNAAPASTTTAPKTTINVAVNIQDPAIQKRIAEIQAKKAAAEAAKQAAEEAARLAAEAEAAADAGFQGAPEPEVKQTSAQQDFSKMTNEDFMALIGDKSAA